jgi:5-methyltetrahydrofolate--homocysteine methyltransferase
MYDPANEWWQRVLEFTRAAMAGWGSQVAVGHTDLGGALDVLASLCGTHRLLLDLYDAPGEVERVEGALTRLWLRYYDELHALIEPSHRGTAGWSPCWFPGRGYMLQSDFSYMISPQMFERFVLPSLTSWCDALDDAFYHLDGPGQVKHLDMLLSIPRLRGIQWVPGEGNPPAQDWLPLLRRIREAGKLCYVDVTREGALQITRALGGKGFLFRITEFLERQEAVDFLSLLPA